MAPGSLQIAAAPAWRSPGSRHPCLEPGLVHVWRADLDGVAVDAHAILSADERARAERILDARKRVLWARSRAVLRALLAGYVEEDPRSLRFRTGAHGKLELDRAPSFSLSHTGALALYAVAPTIAVGVDAELIGRARVGSSLAARVLGRADAERLARLPAALRRQEFLRAWTRREAALKCLGLGLGAPARARQSPHGPWVAELDAGPRALAAVAAEAPPRGLCCWAWPDGRP